jgi:hypothetical protein
MPVSHQTRTVSAPITGLLNLNQMIRCDNDECPLSTQCTRFLIYHTDADGLQRFIPRITSKYDTLLGLAEIDAEHLPMIRTECDYFIELAPAPDNFN